MKCEKNAVGGRRMRVGRKMRRRMGNGYLWMRARELMSDIGEGRKKKGMREVRGVGRD